ncbi:MAG: 50S ribosomal protein L4 [Myxococcales bacterium]|nr:50S ribosomal protein L4 [Myxococcota bacterium]MDW8282189.1 50S ribosomal protein L4 [Myxococcales bacterium]
MPKLDIMNLEGQRVGDIELDDAVFGVEVKEHLLWEVVKQQLASRRAGTHSTLRRGEVRGGGKKPYRQKGTGQARQGSIRAPNHVGGGKVFSPKPRDYSYTVPKKVRRAALCSALSLRAQQRRLVVLDSLELPEAKTRRMATALRALGLQSALVVDRADNVQLARSVRNLPYAKYLAQEGLNVYDVLNYESLVMTAAVARQLEARLGKGGAEQRSAA